MAANPKCTPEFKQRAVELCRESGTSFAAVSRELGIDDKTLRTWVDKADGTSSEPDQNPFRMSEELRDLRKENARLRKENEILLKASAPFAGRQP